MSVIESTSKDGGNSMSIQPDDQTQTTVEELIKKGHTNIHDKETGEVYHCGHKEKDYSCNWCNNIPW